MKYCVYCGAEIHDEAVVCVKCGRAVETPKKQAANDGNDALDIIIKIFLILGCVSQGWLILPLAWCLPITISIFKAMRENRPIGTGLKVCALLFVNMIGGICLLCKNDEA